MKNLDLKKLYAGSVRMQMVFFALVFIFSFYIGYRWDIASMQQQLTDREQLESDLKQQFELAIRKEYSARTETTQYPSLQALLKTWKGKLVNHSDMPEILNQILKIGAANHLYFSTFNPAADVVEGAYTRVPIKIVVQGDYHQIAIFFSQIANLPWVMVIGDFTIADEKSNMKAAGKEEGSTGKLLTTEMILSVYLVSEKPTS